MQIPILRGRIERRILVNYRVDPGVLAAQLPPPFRPKLVRGFGIAGICLIRLAHVRPARLPAWLGIASENAAHRVAVDWDDPHDGTRREGVFVRRRDTNLWLNSLAGGRLFPGVHHPAQFTVRETDDRFDVAVASRDGDVRLSVRGCRASRLPASSVFSSLEEASAFFESGSLGYSATNDPARFDGLELRCHDWAVEPLEVEAASSSYFDDESLFPPGSIELDHALLMRRIEHEWHGRADLCSTSRRVPVCML